MRKWWIGACALVVLGCRAEERDQALGSERPTTEGRANQANDERASTERLLCKALKMSQREVETSGLAKDRAASPAVRAFAAMMVSEHQQDIDAIRKLAADEKLNVEPAAKDDPIARAAAAAHEQRIDELRALRGAAFDFAYMGPQADKHVMLVKVAEEGRKLSNDPEIDSLFTKLAGRAHAHRTEIARALPEACGGTAGKPDTGGTPHGPEHGQERHPQGTQTP